MKNEKKKLIFLVDDDTLYLKALEIEFELNNEIEVKSFTTGEQCLENLTKNPDVIILDYYLDSVDKNAINGLQTLSRIKTNNHEIPVIMLSSQDSIDVAVNCMKNEAFDYIVKSETAFIRLQKAIATIFRYQKIEKTLTWYMERT